MNAFDPKARLPFPAETYQALFQTAPDAVLVIEAGRIIAANPQAERLFGYGALDLLGELIEMLVPERFHGVHPGHRNAYTADPVPRPMGSGLELLARHRSGSEFPVEISLSPLRQGDRTLVSVAVRDVTERKRAQDELRKIRDGLEDRVQERTAELNEQIAQRERGAAELRRQARMLDLVSEPIFAWDMDKGVVFWNRAATLTYGYEREEVLGRMPHEFLKTHHPQGFSHVERELLQDERWSGELLHKTRDGPAITVETRMALFPTSDGDRLVLECCRDITSRRAAEETLRQAQKMEAVGQLTGGIAHDFNNLLTIILANLQLLDDALPSDPSLKELAQSATRAAHRGSELTRKLLVFARRQRLEASSLDVNELITGMTRMLVRALGEHIHIDEVLSPDLDNVFVDAGQLETALLNLVVNARDAMRQGGRLTITTSAVTVDASPPAPEAGPEPGSYVVVTVADTGSGMAPEIAARAFEPFFTTKEVGKGTGLGLSMVYGFAKQSEGHIHLESRPQEGTTVSLYLPRSNDAKPPPKSSASALPTGKENILLVEDNDDVRTATSRMLSGLGYRVVEVADPATALKLLATKGSVRLLLTDVVLAHEMSGPELAAKARHLRSKLKVVFMSGYVRDPVAFHEQLDGDAHFLAKPFSKEELATKVRLALDEDTS